MPNIRKKKLINNILLIIILLSLISCNNKNKNKTSNSIEKMNDVKKLNLIFKIKPFKNKIVYRYIENRKDTFINLLDKKTKTTIKIAYPNKILSNIVLNKDKYYFLEENKLVTINPQNGNITKLTDIKLANKVSTIMGEIVVLTTAYCSID